MLCLIFSCYKWQILVKPQTYRRISSQNQKYPPFLCIRRIIYLLSKAIPAYLSKMNFFKLFFYCNLQKNILNSLKQYNFIITALECENNETKIFDSTNS